VSAAELYRSFLLRLPLSLLVAMLAWAFLLRPVLDGAVSGFAEILLRSFEYPRVTRLVVDDHLAQVRRTDLPVDSGVHAISLTENHFNTIVLLALYLAMPRPFSRRQLERLFMGWSVLYLTQTLNLYFHVKLIYAGALGDWSFHHYSQFARDSYAFLQYFTDLPGRFSFPFLIWLGFNWDHLTALLGTTTGSQQKSKRSRKAKSS
jgi:hypothetical protein